MKSFDALKELEITTQVLSKLFGDQRNTLAVNNAHCPFRIGKSLPRAQFVSLQIPVIPAPEESDPFIIGVLTSTQEHLYILYFTINNLK